MRPLALAERSGEDFALNMGAKSIADLRKLPGDKLISSGQLSRGTSWPTVDGWVIPDDQYKIYESKQFNDTPILVGYNSDEGASFGPPRSSQAYIA